MGFTTTILPEAKEDMRLAALWYNNRKFGLGKEFLREVKKSFIKIEDNPYSFAIRFSSIRVYVVRVFPYVIHYTIDKPKSTIVVVGVFHTSQSPDNWR